MDYATIRVLALTLVFGLSAYTIVRHGVLFAFVWPFLGGALLYWVYHAWPAPSELWDEDREEIHFLAPILLIFWCFPIAAATAVWRTFFSKHNRP